MTFTDAEGAVQRVTTSDEIIAQFSTNGRRSPQLQLVEQNGNFRYSEGPRKASAQQARYTPADESIVATGNPRFEDTSAGLIVSADTLRFHRRTSSVDAENNVKTTYTSAKAQSNGALLASSDPVHVTSQRATAASAGKARFVGNARLWQGDSIIEASTIEFDRTANTLIASAGPTRRVQVNFTQTDNTGKQVPVSVGGGRLFYSDSQRQARFTDSVKASGRDVIVTAHEMDVLLKPRSQSGKASTGQIDQILASGAVHLEERNPVRTADGEKLTFFADSAKYVLTAGQGKTCSIFDAEHGKIEAVSLTFYSHDDTVQVGSGENTRVVTKTQIKENSRR
jgi:lipopolysaccharide export system protein LptA